MDNISKKYRFTVTFPTIEYDEFNVGRIVPKTEIVKCPKCGETVKIISNGRTKYRGKLLKTMRCKVCGRQWRPYGMNKRKVSI